MGQTNKQMQIFGNMGERVAQNGGFPTVQHLCKSVKKWLRYSCFKFTDRGKNSTGLSVCALNPSLRPK